MKVRYGSREISFVQRVNPRLKHAYITVDFNEGVVLKSPPVEPEQAMRMVREKAAWIVEKLKLVAREPQGDIVTGTRMLYLGKKYYTQIIPDESVNGALVTFNYSSFKVWLNPSGDDAQGVMEEAFERFYSEKARLKIRPRVAYWSRITGLEPSSLGFRKPSSRWGTCSPAKKVSISTDAVKLPYSLIDYIIVHELCHIRHTDHGKGFWKEVEKYIPNYRELEERIAVVDC